MRDKDSKTNKEKDKKKKSRLIKEIVAFLIAAVVVWAGFSGFEYYLTHDDSRKVSYEDFMYQVDQGNIEKVIVDKQSSRITWCKGNDVLTTKFTTYPGSDDFIERLLSKGVDVRVNSIKDSSGIFSLIGTIAMIGAIYFIYSKQINVGEGFETINGKESTTTFDDVAGMSEIKSDLLFIAEMMKNPEYEKSGAKIPKGILLEGPPGNGKTLIARAFAGETGVNFIAANACDFSNKFVGVGSLRVNQLFKEARECAPCVVFIDEIDAVGSKRTDGGDSASKEFNTILTAILNQMDGFSSRDGVLVLAATNRADSLDPALLRPGRFDRKLIITLPDKMTRRELLKFATKDVEVDDEINFDRLAGKTHGFSCSEITAMVNEAVINSVKNKRSAVMQKDFETAILESQLKGHIKENYEQSDRERQIVAYHEAGHAIVSYYNGGVGVSAITIRPTTSGAGGFTITDERTEDLAPIKDMYNRIVMCYGGRAAEISLLGGIDMATTGAAQDIKVATELAKEYIANREGVDFSQCGEIGEKMLIEDVRALLRKCDTKAREIVITNWHKVDAVAKELLKCDELSRDEFLTIINGDTTGNASAA